MIEAGGVCASDIAVSSSGKVMMISCDNNSYLYDPASMTAFEYIYGYDNIAAFNPNG